MVNLWKSNLIISEIPWNYYLHACSKFYALELSKLGRTIWVNPPSRNPFSFRVSLENKNLAILRPWMYRRDANGYGFDRFEVRKQINFIARIYLGTPTSIWSISTAYHYYLTKHRPLTSIFWSGDFFDPVDEYEQYEDFDITLCLTPPKLNAIPDSYTGKKVHFNMCCGENFFKNSYGNSPSEEFDRFLAEKKGKVAGYVGTLSTRRLDYELLLYAASNLPDMSFVLVGKDDGEEVTEHKIKKLLELRNVWIIQDVDYEDIPKAINLFDICMIPYLLDSANVGTCPTKFIEYAAIGKPIVSTRLPGLEKFKPMLLFSDSNQQFIGRIEEALLRFPKSSLKKQRILAKDSQPEKFITSFESLLRH